MLLDLQLFELKCADMPDFEIVGKFTDPNAAIEYAAGHVVDFALLDIDMPGMDGIHLAQALRRLRSDIIIVFATAHPKFAVEALKMKADYIIFKPFDREDIADVMERAKLLRRRQCKRIHFHTFGAFDMLVDGEPVPYCLARIPQGGETRGNLAAGGRGEARPLTESDWEIARRVGPTLKAKGLIFVGLDIIGDRLTEINVTSPTCVREIEAAFPDISITGMLMDAIERRITK